MLTAMLESDLVQGVHHLVKTGCSYSTMLIHSIQQCFQTFQTIWGPNNAFPDHFYMLMIVIKKKNFSSSAVHLNTLASAMGITMVWW